jgi:hypothetical protein
VDHLGSVRVSLDYAGNIRSLYDYTPFGAALPLSSEQSREKYIGKQA